MLDKKSKRIFLAVFLLYIIILLRLTVFRSRLYPIDFSVNLSLFTDLIATYYENGIWMVLYLVIGNIVWFVPFGFSCAEDMGKAKIVAGLAVWIFAVLDY